MLKMEKKYSTYCIITLLGSQLSQLGVFRFKWGLEDGINLNWFIIPSFLQPPLSLHFPPTLFRGLTQHEQSEGSVGRHWNYFHCGHNIR